MSRMKALGPRQPCTTLLLIAFLTSALGSKAQTQSRFTFGLENVRLRDGSGEVKFRVLGCEPQLSVPADLRNTIGVVTSDKKSKVLVDLDGISSIEYEELFRYPFYVVSSPGGKAAPHICLFNVLAYSVGRFADRIAPVTFFILAETGEREVGVLDIPIHSSHPDLLDVQLPSSLVKIPLEGRSQVTLTVTNRLPDLPVVVDDIVVTPRNVQDWHQVSLSLFKPRDIIKPGQLRHIELTLVPRFWHALGSSIYPVAPDRPQDVIAVSVRSHTPGGVTTQYEVMIPVQFQGTWLFWGLFVLAISASLLGGLPPLIRRLWFTFYARRRSVVLNIKHGDGSEARIEVQPQDEQSVRELLEILSNKSGRQTK